MTTETRNTSAPRTKTVYQDDDTLEVVEFKPEQIAVVSLYVTDENGATVPPRATVITSGSSTLPGIDSHADLRTEFAAWEAASDEDLLDFDQSLD